MILVDVIEEEERDIVRCWCNDISKKECRGILNDIREGYKGG